VQARLHHAGRTTALAALFLYGAAAADDPAGLFERVKAQMSSHLAELPNYTCHETINRFARTGTNFRQLDTLDLDVVFTGQGELYSRTGADRFGEEPLEKIVSSGTISNGALGSHIDLLLSQDGAEFKYAGTGKKDGRKTFRFDLTVPIEKSHFQVRHNRVSGVAGYKGSLWVDAETYDPVRVEFKVNRIPSQIGVRSIEETLHYIKLTIGKSDFHLPERSDLSVTDEDGNTMINLIKLKQCREFTADSVVKYASPSQGTASREPQGNQDSPDQ